MSVHYQAVLWNRQKRIYDSVVGGGVLLYLGVFCGVGALVHPNATVETLLIRGLGTAALLLLHIILCIGPLCRLDKRFLPLLYNRRHLGVTMFVLALAHGVFSLVQFHALGDVNPVVSLLTSNTRYEKSREFSLPTARSGGAGDSVLDGCYEPRFLAAHAIAIRSGSDCTCSCTSRTRCSSPTSLSVHCSPRRAGG